MSILIDKNTKVVVAGITGNQGSFHTYNMMKYGTQVVAGVHPKKAGTTYEGPNDAQVPIFKDYAEAVEQTGANAAMVMIPPKFAPQSIIDAAKAGIPFVVCITEYIPVLAMARVRAELDQLDSRLLGPNCPGLITPGAAKIGIIPGSIATEGPVGVVSKSGTLTYEVVDALTRQGIGQTTCVGIGGDPINGTSFIDTLALFEADAATQYIVLIGEIGGNDEEQAAEYIKHHITKPVFSFIAGSSAPPGRRMGHAGAIVEGSSGTAEGKFKALEAAGVVVVKNPDLIAAKVKELVDH